MVTFGPSLGLPTWLLDLSPFTHVPSAPAVPLSAGPVLGLGLACVLLAAGGLLLLRRRNPRPPGLTGSHVGGPRCHAHRARLVANRVEHADAAIPLLAGEGGGRLSAFTPCPDSVAAWTWGWRGRPDGLARA